MVHRILITGSRTWTDTGVIREALAAVWHPEAVLVVGACPQGADLLAEQCWTHWGGTVERHPANWTGPCRQGCRPGHRRVRRGRSTCPTAGYARNHEMIESGADICLAFIRARSPGASHCACWAELAGIETVVEAVD
jgi:hypothetical protein